VVLASMFTSAAARLVRARIAAVLAAMLMVVALPALARADTATADERTVVLVDPAVVFVDTSVTVSIRLTYSDHTQYSGVSTISKTYHVDYGSGSGFAVNPNGTIVTASHVVEPVQQDLRNYAANKLFQLPKGKNPFDQYSGTGDVRLDNLLQQCYDGVACKFQTKRTVRVYIPVQIAGVSEPKPLPARVLRSTGFDATDVAILQVNAQNMPTVPLATTANDLKSGQPITALGFPGSAEDLPTGFTEPAKLFGRVSNVRSEGAGKVVEASIPNVSHGTSGGPAVDSNGKVVGLISYTRLDPDDGSPTQIYLRTVDDIRAALRSAGGVQAARGEVDNLFSQAMSYFWDRHYSAALPLYQEVLNLYDGHPLAKTYLSQSQAKAGGPEDVPLPAAKATGRRSPVLLIGVPALVVVVVLVAMVVLARRRRRRTAGATARVQPPTAGAGATDVAVGVVEPPAHDGLPPRGGVLSDLAAIAPLDEAQPSEMWHEAATVVATVPSSADGEEPTELAAPVLRFCSQCGHQLDAEDRFCRACGSRAR
jgi:S1-C subfamily serine protease